MVLRSIQTDRGIWNQAVSAPYAGCTELEHYIWETMRFMYRECDWSLYHLLPFWLALLNGHVMDCKQGP